MSDFKTVPVVATDEMIISAMRNVQVEDGGGFRGIGWIEAVHCYREMLAAAPSPWVSVGDRLPDAEKGSTESASVIVCLNDFVITTGFYCHFENEWYGEDGYSFEEASNGPVTHWMPLPEAPGAKERNE